MSDTHTHAVAITPANTSLATPPKRLTVGGAGTLVIVPYGDKTANTTVTINCAAGAVVDIKVDKVISTSTATAIVGSW